MSKVQKVAAVLSHILALAVIVLVVTWITDKKLGGGGVSWAAGDAGRVFNWHPVMMVTGFAFMTVAALAFRIRWWKADRRVVKVMHAIEWTVALSCGVIGLVAVLKAHFDGVSGYKANFYSLHSWVGLAVCLLFLYQFFSAFFSFGMRLGCISPVRRARTMSFHRYMGNVIYVVTAGQILTGIQHMEGFIQCAYDVTTPDYNPFIHYEKIPYACKISHALGMAVLALAFTTSYALYNFPENQAFSLAQSS
mmetsp:Transcript_3775/g.5554  ORF Transcript_3775/g.5554 Transcript_3775/m.5554 type:complete len:250 (-) Transcript_3775:59-808(-)